jgi:aspartyl-tRNA(Asn)/glutamyl-tRNA(Gln) amidotransferase subunit B
MTVEAQSSYFAVIGLEIHIQLSTSSKLFSEDASSYGAPPNTNVSPYTLGHPGTLPMLNKKVIEYAMKMGIACGCAITKELHFCRKHYFYPDLPKGYQITQDKAPIGTGGCISFPCSDGSLKDINLKSIHLEEDAGRSMHRAKDSATLIDFNRAGVPLLEIVTLPELRNEYDAQMLLQEVRRLVRYLDISDGNMEEGSMRCDVNVSVRHDTSKVSGERVELKNINSMKRVRDAIRHEIERQVKILGQEGVIIAETRVFDPKSGRSIRMRAKEHQEDYRFFPDPNISPVHVSETWKSRVESEMPFLPAHWRHKFISDLRLPWSDAYFLADSRETAEYFNAICLHTPYFKTAANLLQGPVQALLNKKGITIGQLGIAPENMAEVAGMIEMGLINKSMAVQQLLPLLVDNPAKDPKQLAADEGLTLLNADVDLETMIDGILLENPAEVERYKQGKVGLLGWFMAALMKKTGGKADPERAHRIFQDKLR